MRRPDRVLADDTTVEDLAARGKQPGKPHGKSSEVQYEAARKKYWLGFCKYANWDPVEKAVFLEADGTVRDGTFRQLFIWLYELDNASNVETRIARDPGMPGMLPVRDGHFHDHQGVTAARVRGHRIGAAQCVSC